MGILLENKNVIAASILLAVLIFQLFALIRYINRLPHDTLGIGLYTLSIALLILALVYFYKAKISAKL